MEALLKMDGRLVLNFIWNRRTAAGAIPRRVTTLSVSWLNRQFKAVAVHRGIVQGQWEYPGEIEGPNNFEHLLRQAVQNTGYRGQTVSLVLAHPRLVQQALDVPPVKTAALRKILQRQAQQQKLFMGDAVWTTQTSSVGNATQRVVLHLLPRALLQQLIQGCHNNGLFLTAVAPPSGVLHQQLRLLPLEKGQAALLAAETAGSTTVIIGRGDGQVLMARTLTGSWNENAEQLATDLNRTILFFNEQFGAVRIHGLWLFGPGAEGQCQAVQRHTQLPVAVSPADPDPFYYATEVLKVRPATLPNFISPEMQHAPRRQVYAQVVGAATALVVVALLALAAYATVEAGREAANIENLARQQKRLETERHTLQQRNFRLARHQQIAGLVLDDRQPPVPLWFLGYLSEVTPPELVVTNLHIVREADVWKVHVAGALQSALRPSRPTAFSDSVALLASRLTNAPFHLLLLDERERAGAAAARPKGGVAAWIANVIGGVQARPPAPTDQFAIEGAMR
jgi:hypothetical protein